MKNTQTKEEIRKYFLTLRGEITQEERKEYDKKIAELVLADSLYKDSDVVYCYASFRDEVSTKEIIETTLASGKKLAVPRVVGRRKMEFCYIRNRADLRPGFCSIPEPGPWCRKAPFPADGNLVLIPGAAFDRHGIRIGYGGGYYDSYFAGKRRCILAALAYSIQCADKLPSDSHDVAADVIFTEKELIRCTQDFRVIR